MAMWMSNEKERTLALIRCQSVADASSFPSSSSLPAPSNDHLSLLDERTRTAHQDRHGLEVRIPHLFFPTSNRGEQQVSRSSES